jgi:hypothetical protein
MYMANQVFPPASTLPTATGILLFYPKHSLHYNKLSGCILSTPAQDLS